MENEWLKTKYAILQKELIDRIYISEPRLFQPKYEVYATETYKKKDFGGAWKDVLLDRFDTLEEASAYMEVLEIGK